MQNIKTRNTNLKTNNEYTKKYKVIKSNKYFHHKQYTSDKIDTTNKQK